MRSFILSLLALCFTVQITLSQSDNKSATSSTTAYDKYPPLDIDISYHGEWTKTHYPKRIKDFMNDPLNKNEIVFLGNSITEQGGQWSEKFGSTIVRNRGISGDVTEGVIARLGEIYDTQPRAVFLLIGINDLFLGKTPEFVADKIKEIAHLINEHSPSTKLYVQTVLPTSYADAITTVTEVNEIIIANEANSPYSVIDLHSVFANEEDLFIKAYTNDGVHLTTMGYAVWVAFEKSLVSKLIEK